ncbi:MAG TPA: DMT family transporter [archaeon]|nr:DMT family transporter [archaeon]
MRKETLGVLLAIAAALVSGVSIPANKVFVSGLDPLVFTAVRAILIGVVFLFLSLRFGRGTVHVRESWKALAAIAVIGGAAAFFLFFSGLSLTTAGRAAFLQKTLPLFVALLAFVFLKERLSRLHWGALGLMLLGLAGIAFATISPAEFWTNPQLGDLLVIGATVLWAVETVISRKAMVDGATSFVVVFARMFFGGAILFGAVLLTKSLAALLALTQAQLASIGISTGLLFLYVLFFYGALKLISAARAATLLLLAPVVSLLISIGVLGEPAPLLQLAGSAAILVGAFLVARSRPEQVIA